MKDQINTIRELLNGMALAMPATANKALAALAQLEAMVGEPVAWGMQHTDGAILDVISPEEHAREEGGYVVPLYRAAPVAQQPQYDQTALELCAVCGWKTLIPGDCCLNCERNKAQQPQAEAVPQDVGQLEYRGNSVSYIHQKMTAYRGAIDAVWQAIRDAGHPPDGRTPLDQAIKKALAPQQAEAVPMKTRRVTYTCPACAFSLERDE